MREAPLDITVRADPKGWAERLEANILPTGSLRRAAGGIASNSGVEGTGRAPGARGGVARGAAGGGDGGSASGEASKSESCRSWEEVSAAGPVRGMDANSSRPSCGGARPGNPHEARESERGDNAPQALRPPPKGTA